MKLTRRQQEFITNLIDLSGEVEGPIHYSALAERLGVSPFTAYDMLCLLEEKGLVTSEYQLAADKDGPGRAERLFYPRLVGARHKEFMDDEFGGRLPEKEERKRIVMNRIQSGEFKDKELAAEVLARVPDIEQGEISYCVEIISVVALRLQRESGRQLLLEYVAKILTKANPKRENLMLLGGFAFGVLAQECVVDDEWVQQLLMHIQQYFSIVLQLKPQECTQLANALAQVFDRLAEE